MARLVAGTPWDRPPTCEQCGKPEAECACPPERAEPKRLAPPSQTARLRLEKRPRGKLVTVIAGLDPEGNNLPALAASLKTACGTGGTLKDSHIELQGDHLQSAARALQALGYKTRTN